MCSFFIFFFLSVDWTTPNSKYPNPPLRCAFNTKDGFFMFLVRKDVSFQGPFMWCSLFLVGLVEKTTLMFNRILWPIVAETCRTKPRLL